MKLRISVILIKFVLPISLFFIMACASNNTKTELQNFYKELDTKINIMTYDEALMRWGEPSSVVEGDEMFLVTWREEKSSKAVLPYRRSLFVVPVSHGSELRLSFDKNTKKMIKWVFKRW